MINNEKLCNKCKLIKNIQEFYVHARMHDGYLNKCKECTKTRVKKHRTVNIEKIKAYDKKRDQSPERKELKKQYAQNNKEVCNQIKLDWAKRNRKKRNAHQKVYRVIKSGKLIKPDSCSICSSDYLVEAHHKDYSKPLEVEWICKKCHSKEHWGDFSDL